ncbi:nucleoporin-domain-containing protein, partial [Aureobasidium melanogenum]
MALAAPQPTPQRPLPGAFFNTPAPGRPGSSGQMAQQPFRSNAAATLAGYRTGQVASRDAPTQRPATATQDTLAPIERAARTVNEALQSEAQYPALDNYVGQGISNDYDTTFNNAWQPFQRTRSYDIPEQIFEQANMAQVSTHLGLFAELNHAFIVIDSSLYLWDYTHPNPELIGFEDQTNAITAVKLVKPRKGVFIESITHLLVVATHAEILLIGLAAARSAHGGWAVQLYSTNMKVPVKGTAISYIESSDKTGRIFFGGNQATDVWELTYQQEERWFASRCSKINHTNSGITSAFQLLPFGARSEQEHIKQMVVDDSRDLLYTLSSSSTIRVYHMKPNNVLDLALSRPFTSLLAQIAHMVPSSDLLARNTSLVSISPISAQETNRLSLQALTSTGCRIFLSATSGAFYGSSSSSAPTSMQVHHIKFPPKDGETAAPQPQQPQSTSTSLGPYASNPSTLDTNTRFLANTKAGVRYAPGYSCWVVPNPQDPHRDSIFFTAPDSGRIKMPRDASHATLFPEIGMFLELPYPSQGIGLVSPPFAAASTPLGFANELAVQFDQSPTEIAVLTSTGVQIMRRRRLVDIFASLARYGGDAEGRDGQVKKFIRNYGRTETAATALAVACGEASDGNADARITNITEPDIVDFAREAFITQGGKPMLNENSVLDNNTPAIDNVRPSPRHDGMALYITRLVRSIWRAPVLTQMTTPVGGLVVTSTVALTKLQNIQRALNSLQEFLNKNKSSIEGLSGPESLGRVANKQDELSLQGEHRAMNALIQLISSIIEGIAFVLVLFDEKVDEIILSLPEGSRERARQLTYEGLFCSPDGRNLAKELVKAIVNRNITNGSNVDTVAEALRRRCGSFCSADDVVIFKAQEQVKRASEAGPTSEASRRLLNESLRLFQKVAGSLSMEHLEWAVSQYIPMSFYAGAIQLALTVAHESDRANRALSWLRDDCPEDDPRQTAFEGRKQCYDLIHQVIVSLEQTAEANPDGAFSVTAKRQSEAYEIINNSEDEVFQNNLYDWYMGQGWNDRLLEISSPYVISYLRRRMDKNPDHADLLWRYYAHHNNFLEAASVQLLLAKSGFDLNLEQRISYLSRARTNASIRTVSLLDAAQGRQQLLREITDLLEVGNIQDDILQRMKSDSRLTEQRRPQVLKALDGQILEVAELFNQYADQAGYYDICILIYHCADHRNPADIQSTWQLLIEQVHQEAENSDQMQPFEAVALKVRSLGQRLHAAEATFPIPILLPMLLRYALEFQNNAASPMWVMDTFLELDIRPSVLVPVVEQMYYTNEQPFVGRHRRILAADLIYLIQAWLRESERHGDSVLFGSDDSAAGIDELLTSLAGSQDLDAANQQAVDILRGRIAQAMR